MKKVNYFLLMMIFFGVTVLCPVMESQAADPAELVTLRQQFTAEKKGVVDDDVRSDIFDAYIEKLIDLESDLRLNKRDMQGVNAVRKEMRAVRKELTAPSTVAPPPVQPQMSLAEAERIVKEAAAQKAAEDAVRKAAAEAAAQKAAEEAARKAAAEAAAQKAAEEAARKAAAEAAAQKAAEEAARKAAAEAAAQKAAEEAARKAAAKKAAEEAAKKAAAEAAAKKAAEDAARKAAAEAAAKKAAEEATRKAAAEAAAKKKATAAAAAKKAAELAAKKAAAAAAVVAKPKPAAKPAAIKKQGKAYVSNVQGQAAAADFSKNNVYEFKLPKVGRTCTLTFYATGRSNIDSDGKIWLITPDGRREKVGTWEADNVSTDGVKSYKDLKPIDHDLSKLVKKPGNYKVEFEWINGAGPLYIYRVELTS
jgi:hypothetical protein